MSVQEQRRSKRKSADGVVQVINAMTGQAIGRIGNLSIDGMMLITNCELRENGLFQFVFHLPGPRGQSVPLEVGVHEQWIEAASVPGQFWAGFRIVDIAPDDFVVLKRWIEGGGAD